MALRNSTGNATDPFALQRFVDAQATSYATALTELRSGRKRTHWMWFIFPQVAGLGFSSTAQYYAISHRAEAQAYLDHPILGPRLVECARAVLALENRSAAEIFGAPDDLKLKSSMTLFATLEQADPVFGQVLDKYYAGEQDQRTLHYLQ